MTTTPSVETETARRNMVEQQLRGSSIRDARVLQAFLDVRREDFVPAELAGQAFADTALPLPCGQHMMSPRNQALLLQAVDLRPGEHVLEIGTGTGFLSACMGQLGARVDSLEIHDGLAASATRALAARKGPDVSVQTIDAWAHRPGPRYDAVVITASMPDYDPHFEQWLQPQGRLFVVVGRPPVMEACLIRQYAPGKTSTTGLFELELDPILGSGARA